jgi:TonB family protein
VLRVFWRISLALAFVASASTAAAQAPDAGTPTPPTPPELLPPRLIEAPAIELPAGTETLPEDASVELELTIDATGAVTEVTVTGPLREDVDAIVVEAARATRFEPARRNGEAIPSRIRFRFRVEAPAPPPATDTETGAATDTEAGAATDTEAGAATATAAGTATDTQRADTEPSIEENTAGFGVTARIRRPEPGAATRITLRGEELTTVPGTFGEPLRVVATLPGVARTPFGLGYFIVRGASFENTGFFVDGFPVPILYHLGAGPAVLSARLVDTLDFYPGGYPARYGRFGAGIVALETGPPDHRGLHLEAEIDLFRASALAVVPIDEDRGVVTAAFRRSYYDFLIPLVVDGLSLSYTDWQLRFDYDLTDRLAMSLFYFGSSDLLDQTGAAGAGVSDEQTTTGLEYTFQRLIGKLVLELPRNAQITWSGMIGLDESSIYRREPGGVDLGAEITGVTLGQRLEAILPAGRMYQTTAGVDVFVTQYEAITTFPVPPGYGAYPPPLLDPQTTAVTVEPIVMTAAPYVEQVVRPGPFEIAAGLRLEYLRYGGYSGVQLDPRGVVRYQINPMITAKVATGLFTQPPQPFQIDHRFGNPRLAPQRSWQSSGGVELALPYDVAVESQLFYTRMYQLPRTQNVLTESARREVYVADGEGRAYGWELMVRRRVEDGLFGWLSYTLAWSERFTEGGATVPFFFDQRHTLNLAVSYAVDGWRFGARFQLSSGRPERPVLGANEDVDSYRFDAIRGGLVGRLPVYHQLDVRIDRDFTIGDDITGSVYLDVLNVYNAKNQEGQIWQYDFERSLNLPGLPILPTIGARVVYE